MKVKKFDQSDMQVIKKSKWTRYIMIIVVRLSVGCADPGMLSNAIRSVLHRSSKKSNSPVILDYLTPEANWNAGKIILNISIHLY